MPDNAFPLAPIVSSLLSDDHLLNLLFSCLVLKNKSSSLCLLVFGAGDLAFRAQERSQYEFEAIAIVCPAGKTFAVFVSLSCRMHPRFTPLYCTL